MFCLTSIISTSACRIIRARDSTGHVCADPRCPEPFRSAAGLRVSPKEVNVLFTDVPSRWIHRRAAVSAETALQIKRGKRRGPSAFVHENARQCFAFFNSATVLRVPFHPIVCAVSVTLRPLDLFLCNCISISVTLPPLSLFWPNCVLISLKTPNFEKNIRLVLLIYMRLSFLDFMVILEY